MNNIIITFEDGTKKEYRKGISLGEVIDDIMPSKEIICGCFDGIESGYKRKTCIKDRCGVFVNALHVCNHFDVWSIW